MAPTIGHASRKLWFGARMGGSLSASLGAALIGAQLRSLTDSEETDLRYGAAAFGATLGWVLFPLLVIALASLFRALAGRGDEKPHWVGVLLVRSLFAVACVLGPIALVPLYLVLTENSHPAALPIFLIVLMTAFYFSLREPYYRAIVANSLVFPASYWPKSVNVSNPTYRL